MHYLWMLLHENGKVIYLQEKAYGPQNPKYFLSGIYVKGFLVPVLKERSKVLALKKKNVGIY